MDYLLATGHEKRTLAECSTLPTSERAVCISCVKGAPPPNNCNKNAGPTYAGGCHYHPDMPGTPCRPDLSTP